MQGQLGADPISRSRSSEPFLSELGTEKVESLSHQTASILTSSAEEQRL